MSGFNRWLLKFLGWKISGWDPLTIRKYVLIVIPHTSNWDFFLGLIARSSLQWDINFVAKDTLFRWPFGKILRWLGGYPVDRSATHNYVDAVARIFEHNDNFRLCIAPEGTRSKVDKLKTGFYYIAKKAEVPIILVAFDYGKKEIKIAPPLSSDMEYDELYQHMKVFYKDVRGKNPSEGYKF